MDPQDTCHSMGENKFHNNTKIIFAFFTLFTFALIVQKQWWVELTLYLILSNWTLSPQNQKQVKMSALTRSGKHFCNHMLPLNKKHSIYFEAKVLRFKHASDTYCVTLSCLFNCSCLSILICKKRIIIVFCS